MATTRKRTTKDKRIPLRVEPDLHAAAHEYARALGYGSVSTMLRVWLRQATTGQPVFFGGQGVRPAAPARRSRTK